MRYVCLLLALSACSAPDYNAEAVANGATLCRMAADARYPEFTFTTNTPATCRSIGGSVIHG